jgi:hypothetical protein
VNLYTIIDHPIPKNGFTGRPNDSIGPNQYKPSFDYICPRTRGLSFSRMALHNSNPRVKNQKKVSPGPGQYTFDLPAKKNFNSTSVHNTHR